MIKWFFIEELPMPFLRLIPEGESVSAHLGLVLSVFLLGQLLEGYKAVA
jgi:hypothetical protein